MRLTLKKYETAKTAVEELKAHQKTIREWDEAMKNVGDVGSQRVVSITIKDGKITTKCEAKVREKDHEPKA